MKIDALYRQLARSDQRDSIETRTHAGVGRDSLIFHHLIRSRVSRATNRVDGFNGDHVLLGRTL